MKARTALVAAVMFMAAPGLALAQADPHHPEAGAAAVEGQPVMPQQMQAMMQMMQGCMAMMQGMHGMQGMPMQGGMGQMPMQGMMGQMPIQGGTMGQGMPMQGMSEAATAYMSAMAKMGPSMMQAMRSADPDVAFVQAMIPHHQGAIDMARAALQLGTDEQVKAWANAIIAAQEKEIAEMQDWLKAHPQ
jgi:hypothetical protein